MNTIGVSIIDHEPLDDRDRQNLKISSAMTYTAEPNKMPNPTPYTTCSAGIIREFLFASTSILEILQASIDEPIKNSVVARPAITDVFILILISYLF